MLWQTAKESPSVEQMATFAYVARTLMELRLDGINIQSSHLQIKL